ncbi:hypothetical protein LSH36_59g07046 [Paralvinella palmiformis]|uniref:G-protein coupled receptors family 1 profile domain-containing protein n=1 Tax=Paralvinella palmiformis TaxID=53620 RepID=A0AAD9K4H4_9ANNE|nr:hypothetical protein LSH36_59g07046 [Paralvinella palmiformis]
MNSTESVSRAPNETGSDCHHFPDTTTTTLAVVISLVAFVTLFGNALVITLFITNKKVRSFGNYFILNLAIADFIIGLSICTYMPYFLTGCWKLGREGCKVFNLIDYVTPLASAWNMAVISLDRYFSVAYPIKYRLKQSPRLAMAFMAIPWLVGFLMFFPSTLFWEDMTGQRMVPEGQCYVAFYANEGYLLFVSSMEFITPFVLVSTLNLLIYLNIRRRTRSMSPTTPAGNQVATISPPKTDQNRKAKEALARDKRTARSLAILVGVFFITWAPYEVCALVNPICGFCIPDSIFDIVFWLLWINSTVNPILYPFIQKRFRAGFAKMLCCSKIKVSEDD